AGVDSGDVVNPTARLTPELSSAPALAREILAVVPAPKGFLVAFRWSSEFMEFDRAGAYVRSCMGVDSLTFPSTRAAQLKMKAPKASKGRKLSNMVVHRIDPSAAEAALSVTTLGGKTAVLRRDANDEGRVL